MTGRAGRSVAGLLVAVSFAGAAAAAVPVELQAALFVRIFQQDRSLTAGGALVVLVVGAEAETAPVVKAFRGVGIAAKGVEPEGLARELPGGRVAYLLPGPAAAQQADEATAAKLLVVSGDATLAEKGVVAIAIGVEGGKPKILVHEKRLGEAGHTLSEQIRQLAKVVG